tara:strand:+ start:448 stop:615 length:168 start_codon:yes stop_codon:yes gene_type:complete
MTTNNNINSFLHCTKRSTLVIDLINKNKKAIKHTIIDNLLEVIDITITDEVKVIK